MMTKLLPGQPVPDLEVPLVGRVRWNLLDAIDMIRARNHPSRGNVVAA